MRRCGKYRLSCLVGMTVGLATARLPRGRVGWRPLVVVALATVLAILIAAQSQTVVKFCFRTPTYQPTIRPFPTPYPNADRVRGRLSRSKIEIVFLHDCRLSSYALAVAPKFYRCSAQAENRCDSPLGT